jgi:hypothetical protein
VGDRLPPSVEHALADECIRKGLGLMLFALAHGGLFPLGMAAPADGKLAPVRQAFPSWMRSVLTEIYLCRTCSCHEY